MDLLSPHLSPYTVEEFSCPEDVVGRNHVSKIDIHDFSSSNIAKTVLCLAYFVSHAISATGETRLRRQVIDQLRGERTRPSARAGNRGRTISRDTRHRLRTTTYMGV